MLPQSTRVRSLSGRLYRPWGFPVASGHLLRLWFSAPAKYTLICEKPSSVPAPGPGSRGDGISHLLRAARSRPPLCPPPPQVVLLSGRSLARLRGKAAREARFAGLFFQHRLILINDIWLGLAILSYWFLISCIAALMAGSIHAVIREGEHSGPRGSCGRFRHGSEPAPGTRRGPNFFAAAPPSSVMKSRRCS